MNATRPTLFAAAATAQAIAGARAVVIVVGDCDGAGDIAPLEAALRRIERLGPALLAVPLLERSHLEHHQQLAPGAEWAARAVFFDPEGGSEDGLVPVPAPAALAFGACCLYGGGNLDRSAGERRLAMLEAAEALLETGGARHICRIASGLQVDPKWTGTRAEDDVELLGLLGSGALAALGERAAELERDARERATEPARLYAELAALRTECETLRARQDQSPLEAELRAQAGEESAAAAHAELASVLSSRSWRALAPLRQFGAGWRRFVGSRKHRQRD